MPERLPIENIQTEGVSVEVCQDCGAVVAGGKTGCLKMFEEILAREFSDFRYGRIHRLTVDTYSLQHPEPYMRSGKSFAAHLTGVCAALEYQNALEVNQAVQQWLGGPKVIEKPSKLPEYRGELTIAFILNAADAEAHITRVRIWAREVWCAWAECHELARRWITEATRRPD